MPRRCAACDDSLMRFESGICLHCLNDLPLTRFHGDPSNPVARLFWGKIELQAASSLLHFQRTGKVQRMLHRLKYKQDKEVGLLLGRLMGQAIEECGRFAAVDALLAVPMHPRKQRTRGYNQSQVLVEGIQEVWPKEAIGGDLLRVVQTPSQTRKGRLDRWKNVKEAFHVPDPAKLAGKHVLIVDDVVTTGATIEGCAKALAGVPDLRLSLFTAACA